MNDINFGLQLKDAFSTLVLKSNSPQDHKGSEEEGGLANAKRMFNAPIYLGLSDDLTPENCIELTAEQAEELAQELLKAVAFLKE